MGVLEGYYRGTFGLEVLEGYYRGTFGLEVLYGWAQGVHEGCQGALAGYSRGTPEVLRGHSWGYETKANSGEYHAIRPVLESRLVHFGHIPRLQVKYSAVCRYISVFKTTKEPFWDKLCLADYIRLVECIICNN